MELDLDEQEQTETVAELEKTDVSATGSRSTVIMTVGDGSAQPDHNTVVMTTGFTSSASAGQHEPSARVKVKIEYPKGWKGAKHFVDGSIREVAPETAAQFVQIGIASIVKQEESD